MRLAVLLMDWGWLRLQAQRFAVARVRALMFDLWQIHNIESVCLRFAVVVSRFVANIGCLHGGPK